MSYDGVITCGKEYAARVNIDDIPWKPWRAGSCYEWNQSKKYAGDGMLVRKRGKRIFFHLSVYPNEYAFDEIERRMLNPRVRRTTTMNNCIYVIYFPYYCVAIHGTYNIQSTVLCLY